MAQQSVEKPRRHFRILLPLLVVIPFIPELVIYLTGLVARLVGCLPGEESSCLILSVPVSDVIGAALQLKVGLIVPRAGELEWFVGLYLVVTLWLAVCYVVLMQGWTRVSHRLLLGFGIALIFAVLPYFGSLLAIAGLENAGCRLNAGKDGTCVIFGGYVGGARSPAHAAGPMGLLAIVGAPLALGAFAVFAVVVRVAGGRAKRPIPSA